jgi:TetR/AcrR family transcriptional repressor of nem operon
MKLSVTRVAENRQKVIDAASRLFRKSGFDRVSVADLMRDAGLTHGGFYNHFDSKTALEAEVCRRAFAHSVAGLDGMNRASERPDREAGLRGYVAHYLSRKRRDADGAPCPMVAFAGDVARAPEAMVAGAYAEGVRAYIAALSATVDGDDATARERAICTASTLIGALTLARSLRAGDAALSDEILEAVRKNLRANLPDGTSSPV